MITRRRKWLIAAAFVLLAGAALWWVMSRHEKREVKLVFLGYTNATPGGVITNGFLVTTNPAMHQALVLVSNSGPSRIIVGQVVRRTSLTVDGPMDQVVGLWPLSAALDYDLPLNPGETLVVTSPPLVFDRRWEMHLQLTLNSAWHRFSEQAVNATPANFRSGMMNLLHIEQVEDATLGPITNLPPAGAGAGAAPASGAR